MGLPKKSKKKVPPTIKDRGYSGQTDRQEKIMRKFVTKLGRFNYTIHNLIAHPIMEILHLFGLSELGDKVHDATLPYETRGQDQ